MRLSERQPIWPMIKRRFEVFDESLGLVMLLLLAGGLVALYLAAISLPGIFQNQLSEPHSRSRAKMSCLEKNKPVASSKIYTQRGNSGLE